MIGSVLLVGWLIAGQATADETALKTEVRKLVRQLDASQLGKREAAESRLLELGPQVLDMLPEPTESTPPEVKQRIGRIRQKLQQSVADSTAHASLITLHARNMPLSKVLAAFRQQTGNPIVDARQKLGLTATDPPLSIDFEKTPFWTALDTVLDRAELNVYPFGQRDGVQLVPRGPGQLPRTGLAVSTGPFRIEPVRVTARRELRSSASPSIMVTLEVAWEPRLRLIGLKQQMSDVKATDETGESLRIEDPDATREALPSRETIAAEMEVAMVHPSRPVKEIATLKGVVRAMIPSQVETFRFNDLLRARKVEQRIAGASVVLDQVRKNGDNWDIFIRLRFDNAGDALESHRNWVLANEAYLEGPDGKPIPFASSETTERSKNEVGMGYVFKLEQPPARLTFVYKTPGTIVTKDFPYEIRGIRLP